MKHRAFTLIEAIVVVAILVILAAILFPVFQRPDEGSANRHRAQCQENLREIGMAFMQYAQDHNEKLPPVAIKKTEGWADSVQPYLKSWQLFQCPTDEKLVISTTDYYYNARLSKTDLPKITFPMATILSGDGKGNQPTNYNLSALPNSWRKDYASPANRHIVRANYLFADGHIKTLNSEKITLDQPSKKHPTFLVK